MILMSELLEDPQFKQFMMQIPKLPPAARSLSTPPWRLYVQTEPGAKWKYRDFNKYSEAWNWMIKRLKKYHDFSLQCKRKAFSPPMKLVRVKGKFEIGSDGVKRQQQRLVVWKPKLPGEEAPHRWCPYCRRPTIFKYYSRHHAFQKGFVEIHTGFQNVERCSICGVSERLAPGWHTYVQRPVNGKKKGRK